MNLAWCLNTAWMWKGRPESRRFAQQTRNVAATQARLLQSILRQNRATWFGSRHHFGRLTSPRAYQDYVPLSTYRDYEAAVCRIAAGEPNVLTRNPVLLLEPTSGSTGGEKLIPYTASLRRQFQRAIAVWIADLFAARPAVRLGRAYWSVSPAFGPRRRSAGRIPIGFDDDAAYLGALERLALNRLLIAPSALARLADIEAFRYLTLLFLLRAEDLALTSVWNPTYLSALLASLLPWQERLCDDLQTGSRTPPRSCPLPADLPRRLPALPRRAEQLRSLVRAGTSLTEMTGELWPRLALISCWTDAAAAGGAAELRSLFPRVEIQPKGLLATEGCVTLPLIGRPAPVLAVGSHFFEFQELGRENHDPFARCRLAHELDRGGCYTVVLTTGGGLYRYRLGDIVEVVDFEHQCPLLRFLGKADRVSDLVGEKLAEPHVRQVLERLFAADSRLPRFALLAPVLGRPPRYRLYLQVDSGAADWCRQLAAQLQSGLEENPHYRYAVQLGQLGTVEIAWLEPAGEPAARVFERRLLESGQKVGAIKPTALDAWTGWPERFHHLVRACASADGAALAGDLMTLASGTRGRDNAAIRCAW